MEVSRLITQKVRTVAEAEDRDELHSKRKAIATLLPYAVWQEQHGQPEILDTVLRAFRALGTFNLMWDRTNQFADALFSEVLSPRAIVLISPYIFWHMPPRGDFVQRWAAAASSVPYTEEVAQSVVETLLQIAFKRDLLPHVTVNVWSWLTKRPSLQPVSVGRLFGTDLLVVKTVRGLKDTDILKSYLILLWSEWNPRWGSNFDEVCAAIREDFGGIGMGRHRADLIQQLDHTLGQLGRGLEHLRQHKPTLKEGDIQGMKDHYGKLKDVLLETNVEAIARTSYPMQAVFTYILTWPDVHRISGDVYVCASPPTPVASRLEHSVSLPHFICTLAPIPAFIRSSRYACETNSIPPISLAGAHQSEQFLSHVATYSCALGHLFLDSCPHVITMFCFVYAPSSLLVVSSSMLCVLAAGYAQSVTRRPGGDRKTEAKGEALRNCRDYL